MALPNIKYRVNTRLPAVQYMPALKCKLGTCYKDAWEYINRIKTGTLVHGAVINRPGESYVTHAWVELPDGKLWEPQSNYIFPKDIFMTRFQAKELVRYTADEAIKMGKKTGKYGPWEERAILLATEALEPFTLGKELSKLVTPFKVEVFTTPMPQFTLFSGEIDDKKKKVRIMLWPGATKEDALAVLAHEYAHIDTSTGLMQKGQTEVETWQHGATYAEKWGVSKEYRQLAKDLAENYEKLGTYPRIAKGIREWLGTDRQPATTKPGITYEVVPGPPGAVYAHADGQPIGTLLFTISGTEAQVLTLNVIDTYQRSGVGSDLYRTFEEEVRKRGIDKVTAYYVDSPQAEAFWKSLGFERSAILGKDWIKRIRPQNISPATEKKVVRKAVSMSKPVPKEVLKDYSDLQRGAILPATERIIYEAELKMPGYPTQYHRITKGQEPGKMTYYKWMIKGENGIWTSVKRFTLKEIMAFIPTQNKRLKVTLPLKGG